MVTVGRRFMPVKSSKTWSARCRPSDSELRLACAWTERAARAVERELERARHDPSIDGPALRSKLGKLKSGARLLHKLTRAMPGEGPSDRPILIAGRDAKTSGDGSVDCLLGHVTGDSLAQIAAALNANVFWAHALRGRRLRLLRRRERDQHG